MTLQLNPNTVDAYESKTLAQMRQLVFDGLGFISPLMVSRQTSGTSRPGNAAFPTTLKDLRVSIINRLGLAVALLVANDSFATVLADVYNATGYAGQSGTHPPGIDTMLTDFVNEAQNTLFRRIQLDKGTTALPTAGTISIDSHAVRMLAIGLVKAHKGQPDAQIYLKQVDDYLNDLTQRAPPNIVGQVNAALVAANDDALRRYELGNTGALTSTFGGALQLADDFTLIWSDSDVPDVDPHLVQTLALANLKKKVGQADADEYYRQYEQQLSDTMRRMPPNATTIVNSTLKFTQQMLYRKYSVFRMERWWTWSLVADQRFYGTFDDDNATSVAPTDGLAVIGTAVTSHNMVTGRAFAAHATLRSGKVIYAGGWNVAGGFPTAVELFDPDAGTFAATGSMSVGRYWPASCLLADGRFFVAGGYGYLKSTEVYNPATGTWSAGPNLTVGRYAATATLMQDGRVLIVGGDSANSNVTTAVVEIYDPSAGTITSTGSLSVARSHHTATLLNDGRILVAGGYATLLTSTLVAEIYNPVTGTFSNVSGGMSHYRFDHTATLLTNGNVILIGGLGPGELATTEIFSVDTNTFGPGGSLPAARIGHSSTLLATGDILVSGGFTASYTTTTAIYSMATGAFSAGPAAAFAQYWSQADLLQDGRVLLAGGSSSDLSAGILNTAMFYDPDTNAYSLTGNLTVGTVFYQVTAYTANGESEPGTEFFVTGVPANTSVVLTFTPVLNQPFVLGFNIYGRVTGGTKQKIGTITRSENTNTDGTKYFVDDGTAPPDGALPTQNNTAGPGNIDPRHVTWVGLSFNDNVWNPLIKGIPPMAFAQNIRGVPTNYEIRQALEIWPAPTSSDWKVQVKGYFEPQVFEVDNDSTTIDWQALYLQTLADAMPRFKTQKGAPWFNQMEIAQAQANATNYIKRLVAGSHMTARYVPGVVLERNAVRPVLIGPYVGYP